jgi:hypothetical protein
MNGHPDLLIERGAELSQCGTFRYLLWRVWTQELPRLGFIMLNPSTADASVDDATIRVCIGRAQRTGCGGIIVANLFPYRATKPADLRAAKDNGKDHQENWTALLTVLRCRQVIAAWGDDGNFQRQNARVIDVAASAHRRLFHLGLTKAGHPKHPLRIPYATVPTLWLSDGAQPAVRADHANAASDPDSQ